MKSISILFICLFLGGILSAQSWSSYNTSNSDIPFDKIHSMDIGPSNEIWIGNDVSGSFNHAVCFSNNAWTGQLQSNWVNDLAIDGNGNLWLSTTGELRKWDGISWASFTPSSSTLGSWASPICVDASNAVWLHDYTTLWRFDGTNWQEFNTSNSNIPSTSISAMFCNGNTLYLATSDAGLVYYENGLWNSYNTSNSNIPSNAVLSAYVSGNDFWLVCQSGDLVRFENGSFISHFHSGLNSTMDIAVDLNGNVWIATVGSGIIKFDGSDFTVFDTSTGSFMDPYNQYLNVEVDELNTIWIGSRSAGLLSYSEGTNDTQIEPHKKLEIFFLGNSFTAANDMPGIVNELANEASLQCNIETYAPGGQFSTDHCINQAVYDIINSKDWDYVVIQDNQGAFVNPPPYVGPDYVNANTQLYDSIKAKNICTSVIWFAGWAAEGGYPTYFPGDNTQSCIERILANVIHMNNSMGEVVGPIGEGWIRSLDEQPSIDLFSSDGHHPSIEGSYLTASVLFSLIFKYDGTNLSYTAGINNTDAAYLRQIGYEVVSDTYNQDDYNITCITPEIYFDLGLLKTYQTYSAYQWLFDNSLLNGETFETLNYINQGIYALYVLDANSCQRRSFDQEFGPLTTASFTYVENNGTVTFTNQSVNSSSWDWDFGDGNYSNEENPIHSYVSSGSYTVTLSATGGTGVALYSEDISITLSIDNGEESAQISLYPNPCRDFFNINSDYVNSLNKVKIFNSQGQLILNNIEVLNGNKVNCKNLSDGLYYVSFTHKNKIYKLPIIKE